MSPRDVFECLCHNVDPSTGEKLRPLAREGERVGMDFTFNSTKSVGIARELGGKDNAGDARVSGVNVPMELLAPSAEASRGELRASGFTQANTVASFLLDAKRQQKVKNGLIYVDEAGMLPIDDLEKLCGIAKAQNARLVLQGDPRQHKSVARHGNMLRVLNTFAGLPVAELKQIWRQKRQDYKSAVADIQAGKYSQGFDKIDTLGWVHRTENIAKAVAKDYCDTLARGESVICIGITHKQNDAINTEVRKILKEQGKIGKEDHVFTAYRSLGWSEAEKADAARFDGTELIQFHRCGGGFEAGDRIGKDRLFAGGSPQQPSHYAVYTEVPTRIAAGDYIRITAGGRTKDKKHRLDNGSVYRVRGFAKGDIALDNGWVLDKTFGHFTHAYSITSFKAQSPSRQRTITAMSREAAGGIRAEQTLVDISRGINSAACRRGI